MWPLAVLAALGVGYVLLKQPAVVSAPVTNSPEERQANVLPANFEAWVRIASPRQIDAIRAITQYQLRALAVLRDDPSANALFLPIDGQNTIPFRYALAEEVVANAARSGIRMADETPDEFIRSVTNDPRMGQPEYVEIVGGVPSAPAARFFRAVDSNYRDRYGLAPGAPVR